MLGGQSNSGCRQQHSSDDVNTDRDLDQPSTFALDEQLLDAKLSPLIPRPGLVSRAALIETARSSDCRVVGVTAPAGYGKSTLLAEWAGLEDRRVAWVALDRFDDDPAALVGLLASAYARIFPHDRDLVADTSGFGVSVLGRAAPRLASAFRASPTPFVMMVDDLHMLRSDACHDVLSIGISGIPRGSQFITASRAEQPHVPRLRASGDALDVGATDLALDEAGARQIFAGANVTLTRELAAAVTERTEGWPVGLYLAAMVSRDAVGQPTISGDDRYVADYLYRESLSHLPEPDQRFLRRTAVLDQLCAPLCEAVLDEPGAQEKLRRLEASNSFLIPLDRRREWYRYHHLFREFLLGELRRVEPEAIAKLHLRAADWYESNGSPVMAVEHLSNTTERDRCSQLVTQLVLPTYQAGHMSTVQRWLSMLGDTAIEAYPPLAVMAGWMSVLAGHTTEAERWDAILQAASFEAVQLDGSASFESARAILRAAFCPAGPEQMMSDASLAVAQEPTWSPWRDTALCMLAEAHLLTGDLDRASSLFIEASTLAAAMGNADNLVISEAELALMGMDGGRWGEAADHVTCALAAIDEHRMHDYATSMIAFAAAARLAMHRGDLKEANTRLTQAMRARLACTSSVPYLAVRSRLQLAKVYWAMSDHATAHHLLREIDDILLRRPALGTLVDTVSELRHTIASSPQAAAAGATPLTPAELRLLPYLQTHLTIREIAERTFVSRNTVSSQVSAVYRKLGVSSRTDAVAQATNIGLLGG
jgi:LuxR family transcriptional regulator, maltose regulon positive regulatory protein